MPRPMILTLHSHSVTPQNPDPVRFSEAVRCQREVGGAAGEPGEEAVDTPWLANTQYLWLTPFSLPVVDTG